MRNAILILLIMLSLFACQKAAIIRLKSAPTKSPDSTITVTKPDTIPDNGAFRLELIKDSSNYVETLFMFKHTFHLNYYAGEDAICLPGFGLENLSSISNDGKDLSIDGLPYTSGMSVGLDVNAQSDGVFSLGLTYENKIPNNIQIWLKDTYMKDSVNICAGNYSFNVTKADTNSFGKRRFKLVITGGGQ